MMSLENPMLENWIADRLLEKNKIKLRLNQPVFLIAMMGKKS